jgi:hypothetical protein
MAAAADDPEYQVRIGAFQQGLTLLGWTEGRNARIAAPVGADMLHRHRLEGLLLPLDDHDRPQSSSANRVTAGALGFLAFTQSRKRPD